MAIINTDFSRRLSGDAAEQMRIAIDSNVVYNTFSQAAAANKGATAGAKSSSYNLGTDAGSLYTAVTGDISVGDLFGNALQDYILYRCHAENTQYAQPARAQAHYAAFGNALGVELKATVALGSASDQTPAAQA